MSCCGLHGVNSYRAKQLQIPQSCCKDKCTFKHGVNSANNSQIGCFDIVKKLEVKFLDPVITLTLFCSFLQV